MIRCGYVVDDLDDALGELTSVLRVGGRLVVGVSDPEAMATMPVTAYASGCGRSTRWSRR